MKRRIVSGFAPDQSDRLREDQEHGAHDRDPG